MGYSAEKIVCNTSFAVHCGYKVVDNIGRQMCSLKLWTTLHHGDALKIKLKRTQKSGPIYIQGV